MSRNPNQRHSGRAPSYLPGLLCLTLFYLLFELAFNARLLDVTGTFATKDEIDSIETIGRIISGIALALVAWKFILGRFERSGSIDKDKRAAALILAAMGCIGLIYWGQKQIIESIVDASSGASRRIAVQLRLVSTAAVDGAVRIDGIDLSPERLRSPEGKSFIALLPFLAFSMDNIESKVVPVMRQVVRHRFMEDGGSPEIAYNTAYRPSVVAVRDSYNEYARGVNAYIAALNGTQDQQQSAWRRYEGRLRAKGRTPANVPNSYSDRIRSDLADEGLNLPRGWDPGDRSTFYSVVASKVRRDADAQYARQTRDQAGEVLPKDLDIQAFSQRPGVQRQWQEKLGVGKDTRLAMNMSLETFTRTIHEPAMSKRVDEEVERLLSPAEDFADGGKQEQLGRDAMTALVVPPLALAFSLIGALTHLYKCGSYIVWLLAPALRWRTKMVAGTVLAIGLMAFTAGNEVTNARVYQHLEGKTYEGYLPPAAFGVRWVVQAQPYFYPVNEWIRSNLLLDLSFGYHPEDRG